MDVRTAALCLQQTASFVTTLRIAIGQIDADYTLRDLIERFMQRADLGESHRYVLLRLIRDELSSKSAKNLTAEDLIAYCRRRRNTVSEHSGRPIAPTTIMQDIVYLRGVLSTARDVWNLNVSLHALDEAKRELSKTDLVAHSKPRTRRITNEELQRILDYYERQWQEGHWSTKMAMKEVVLFLLYSGRTVSEVCKFKWEDVHDDGQKCMIVDKSGRIPPFELIAPARDVIRRRKEQGVTSDFIFPYFKKSISASFTQTLLHKLKIKDLRLQDLRREAAIRLHYEYGKSIDEISRMIGRKELNSLRRDIEEAAADYPRQGDTSRI